MSFATLGTVWLFLVGASYWSGVYAVYNLSIWQVQPPWLKLLVPNWYSFMLMYHVGLNYATSEWVSRAKAALEALDRKQSEQNMAAVARYSLHDKESNILKIQQLITVAFVLWGLVKGDRLLWLTIVAGMLGGVCLHSLASFTKLPALRMQIVVLLGCLILLHARYAGTRRAPKHMAAVRVEFVDGSISDSFLIAQNDEGLFLFGQFLKEPDYETSFFPSSVVKRLKFGSQADADLFPGQAGSSGK